MADTDRPHAVTRLLEQARAGEPEALNRLLPLVYDHLRAMAGRMLHGERAAHTLRPTALVHEAYIRLVDQRGGWQDRAHFFAIAAQAMRRILVDHARAHRASKRGGIAERISLDDTADRAGEREVALEDVLEVDSALSALEALDPAAARIVELRYFGGLTIQETAAAMGLSPATVKREWSAARAWLFRRLSGGTPGG